MTKIICLILVAICFYLPLFAQADFNSLVESSRVSNLSGDQVKAVSELKEAILLLWEDVPLSVQNARLITDKNSYVSRDNNIYAAGEPVYILTELLGYKITKNGQLYGINIATDLYILDENNNVLSGKENFGNFSLKSPIPNTEFYMDLTYTLKGIPAGVYILKTVVRDINSGKATDFVNKIEIQ
ncbi:MAG: hypothetical protein WAQ07_05790 [Candidatus Omnitrophota bacterium]